MPIRGVLVDLLMATMNSLDVWAAAAGDREMGIRWRDEVTARMTRADRYEPYEELVIDPLVPQDLDRVGLKGVHGAGSRWELWAKGTEGEITRMS